MEYENEDEITWTRQMRYSQLAKYLVTIKDRSLSTVVSAEYVSTGQINDGPNWINDGFMIYQR